MQTVQDIVFASLTPRQLNSMQALQLHLDKVKCGEAKYRGVTKAQARAIVTMVKAALGSGLPLPDEAKAVIELLNLEPKCVENIAQQ